MAMGRPRTGRAEQLADGTFVGRVTMKDGSRSPRFPLPEARTMKAARAMVLERQQLEDRDHAFFLAKRKPASVAPRPTPQRNVVDASRVIRALAEQWDQDRDDVSEIVLAVLEEAGVPYR